MPAPLTGTRGHRALLAAVLGTVLVITASAGAVATLIADAATAGVRAGLETRVGADRGFRITIPLADDPAGQDAAVRSALAESFAGIETTIDVGWQIEGPVTVRTLDPGSSPSNRASVAATIPDLAEHAVVVAGAWPVSADEVAIHADAAAELGVEPGAMIGIGDVDLRVAALWRPADPLDPRWLGDDLALLGRNSDGYGPIVVDLALWERLDGEPSGQWTLVPDAALVTPADLREIRAFWASLARDWRSDIPEVVGLRRTGAFPESAVQLTALVDGLFALQPVALLLLAAVGVIALGELGRLIAAGRAAETTLRWARGATPVALAAAAGSSVGAIAAVGAATGSAIVIAAGASPWFVVAVALIATGTAGLAAALATYRVAAARADPRRRRFDARRSRTAGWTATVLLGGAAALAVWQLRLYGSPVVPSADGGSQVDPLVVAAPVLVLAAGVAAALALFPVLASALDRRTGRAGPTTSLAVAELARRPVRALASIAVVALAAGTVTIAAGYSGTWRNTFDAATRLSTGGALRVAVTGPGIDGTTLDALSAVPGVRVVAPIAVDPLSLGESSGSLVAATPAAIAGLTRAASGFDPAEIADLVAVSSPGVELADGAGSVTLRISASGFSTPPTVTLQVQTAMGRLLAVGLPEVTIAEEGADGSLVLDYAGDVPAVPGDTPAAIVAIDLFFAHGSAADGARVSLLSAGEEGSTDPLDGFWVAEAPTFSAAGPDSIGPTQIAVGAGLGRARLTATFDGGREDRLNAPVVVSQALADRYGFEVGDPVDVALQAAATVRGEVVAVVPGVPGASDASALLIDASLVRHAELRSFTEDSISDVWIDAGDPQAVATALRPLLPPTARIDDSTDPAARDLLGAAVVAVALAAGAASVLAIVAVAAVSSMARSARRPEAAILRALGFRPRQQGRLRAVENAVAIGAGLLAGCLTGALVVLTAIGPFAVAAVPNAPGGTAASLALDPVLLGAGAGSLLLVLAILVAVGSAGATRDARTALARDGES
jgi:hypothetical protein